MAWSYEPEILRQIRYGDSLFCMGHSRVKVDIYEIPRLVAGNFNGIIATAIGPDRVDDY